jgi:hypothetical protein
LRSKDQSALKITAEEDVGRRKKKTQNQKNDISQKNAIFKCDPFEHMMKQQTLNYLDVDVS